MNSAPSGSKSEGCHRPDFSLKSRKAELLGLATVSERSWRCSEESQIPSALLVTPSSCSGKTARPHHAGALSPCPGSRSPAAGPGSGLGRVGREGEPSSWRQKGPGDSPEPSERFSAGWPGLSQPQRARRPGGCGSSRSAAQKPQREAGGCGAGPGTEGAAGTREEREEPAEVWAAPAGRSRAAPWERGRCPRSSAQLSRREAEPRASPAAPGWPPTRARRSPREPRAPQAEEEEKQREAAAAAAPARGCAERGRRRSATWGGRGRVCALGRRPRAPCLASRAQPFSGSAADTHPPSPLHPPPPPAAAALQPGQRQLGWRGFLAGSFRAASSTPLDFSSSIPASPVWAAAAAAGWGPARGRGEDRWRLLFF